MLKLFLKINMNYDFEKIVTIISRGLAIIFKPLMLIVLTSLDYEDSARQLSVIYLALTYGIMFSSFDAHKSYYKSYFDTQIKTGKYFLEYLVIFFYTLILGGLVVLAFSIFEFNSIVLLLTIIIYYISEKFFDELLRFKLFSKEFYSWSKIVLFRFFSVLSFFFFFLISEITDSDFMKLFLICFTLCNLIAFIIFSEIKRITRLYMFLFDNFNLSLNILRTRVKESIYLYLSNLFSLAYSSYDRFIVFVFERDFLPIITVIIMIFSIIPVSFETIYFSFRRSEVLKQTEKFYDNLKNKKSKFLMLFVLFFSYLIFLIYEYIQNDSSISSYILLLGFAIMINQFLLALTLIPRDMFYWKENIKSLLKIELNFTSIFLSIFIILFFLIPSEYLILSSVILIGIILFSRFRKYLTLTYNS